MRNKNIRNLVLTGLFIAVGVVLPIGFHAFGTLGPKLLPMQFPILVAGFFLSPAYALAAGVLTPAISSFLTTMPPAFPALPCLMVEFGAYALFLSLIKPKSLYLRLFAALLLGKCALLLFALTSPAFWGFATIQLTNGLIGMAWQIVLVPILIKGFERGGINVSGDSGGKGKV